MNTLFKLSLFLRVSGLHRYPFKHCPELRFINRLAFSSSFFELVSNFVSEIFTTIEPAASAFASSLWEVFEGTWMGNAAASPTSSASGRRQDASTPSSAISTVAVFANRHGKFFSSYSLKQFLFPAAKKKLSSFFQQKFFFQQKNLLAVFHGITMLLVEVFAINLSFFKNLLSRVLLHYDLCLCEDAFEARM